MTGIILFLIAILGNVSAVCCERTTNGGICLNVGSSNYCDTSNGYRVDDTACESTSYCSTGTCINYAAGICMSSTSSACNPSLGGYWIDDSPSNIDDCKLGCCLVGDGWSLVGRATCNSMITAYPGINVEFKESITNAEDCSAAAGPTMKGACVSQTTKGRACTVETKETCTSEHKEFHGGLLCSAPEIGTICTMTDKTTCVDGRNEVFFVDGCGNPANVYDFSKITDVPYWTYIKDPASSDICGYGSANANNLDCGNCNYIGGSTCGKAKGVTPKAGNNICRSLNCIGYNKEGFVGTTTANSPKHGQSWCSQPMSDFENAKPGDLSYRLYCYDGEVQRDLCDIERNSLCNQTDVPVFGTAANCVPNRWQLCIFINNSNDCLNAEEVDCKIQYGVSLTNGTTEILFLNNTNGNTQEIKAACVPKYPPGFNFWEADASVLGVTPQLTTTQVCAFASTSVVAGYHSWVAGNWVSIEGNCFQQCISNCSANIAKSVCEEDCFSGLLGGHICPRSEAFLDYGGAFSSILDLGNVSLNSTWAIGRENLSISLGDCGVKANYIGEPGYHAWRDLFVGDNITIESIPNYDKYM